MDTSELNVNGGQVAGQFFWSQTRNEAVCECWGFLKQKDVKFKSRLKKTKFVIVERKLWAVFSIPCLCLWALSFTSCLWFVEFVRIAHLSFLLLVSPQKTILLIGRWKHLRETSALFKSLSPRRFEKSTQQTHSKTTAEFQPTKQQQSWTQWQFGGSDWQYKRLKLKFMWPKLREDKIYKAWTLFGVRLTNSFANKSNKRTKLTSDQNKKKTQNHSSQNSVSSFFVFLPQIGKKQTNKEPITAPDFECQRLSKLPKVQELIGGFVDLFWSRKTPTRKHQTLCVVLQLQWVEEDSVSTSCDSIVVFSIQLFVVFVDLRETRCSRNTLSLPTSWFRLWLFDRWNKIVGSRRWNLVIVAVVVHTFVMIVVVVFVVGVWLVLDGCCKGWRWREERQKVTVLLIVRLVVALLLLLRPMLSKWAKLLFLLLKSVSLFKWLGCGSPEQHQMGKKQKFIGIVFIFSVFWIWWPVSILLLVSIIQSFNHSIIQSFIQSFNHSIIQSNNHSIKQSFNHSIIQSFNHSIIHSIIQSNNHSSFNHSIIQSFNHSIIHSIINRSIIQTIIHSIQSFNQTIIQSNNHSIKQTINHSINQQFNHSINHSINQKGDKKHQTLSLNTVNQNRDSSFCFVMMSFSNLKITLKVAVHFSENDINQNLDVRSKQKPSKTRIIKHDCQFVTNWLNFCIAHFPCENPKTCERKSERKQRHCCASCSSSLTNKKEQHAKNKKMLSAKQRGTQLIVDQNMSEKCEHISVRPTKKQKWRNSNIVQSKIKRKGVFFLHLLLGEKTFAFVLTQKYLAKVFMSVPLFPCSFFCLFCFVFCLFCFVFLFLWPDLFSKRQGQYQQAEVFQTLQLNPSQLDQSVLDIHCVSAAVLNTKTEDFDWSVLCVFVIRRFLCLLLSRSCCQVWTRTVAAARDVSSLLWSLRSFNKVKIKPLSESYVSSSSHLRGNVSILVLSCERHASSKSKMKLVVCSSVFFLSTHTKRVGEFCLALILFVCLFVCLCVFWPSRFSKRLNALSSNHSQAAPLLHIWPKWLQHTTLGLIAEAQVLVQLERIC